MQLTSKDERPTSYEGPKWLSNTNTNRIQEQQQTCLVLGTDTLQSTHHILSARTGGRLDPTIALIHSINKHHNV